MSTAPEYLLTTSQTSTQWSACLWNYQTGNTVKTYKNGGSAASNTLNLLGEDYILMAEENKPLLHAWPLNSQEKVKNVRLILPEPARVVAVCPMNMYLAVGIGLKLYVWQISSGKLLTVQQKHFQPITCIKFANTSEYLVVTSLDGTLVTYSFADLISLQTNYLPQSEIGQVEPLYTISDNSGPISDIHLGNFGSNSRLITVSTDFTCRIYKLHTGLRLCTLIFDKLLSAVIADKMCWNLFVGTNTGEIIRINLQNPPRNIDYHVSEEDGNKTTYKEHTKKITCLALNYNDKILASGSEDFKVIIWAVQGTENQGTKKILEHKAVITNIRFVMDLKNFHVQNITPMICLKTLERNLNHDCNDFTVSVMQTKDITFDDDNEDKVSETNTKDSKYNELLAINKQLYIKLKEVTEKLNS